MDRHLGMASAAINSPGDLTYAITLLMHLEAQKKGPLRYSSLSAIRASAQDAADEFYRVVMGPHEDKKRRENGPVSSLDSLSLEDVR